MSLIIQWLFMIFLIALDICRKVAKKSNFIIDCMKGMVDDLDPRKGLFDLINFDGTKVVNVTGELLEV